MKILLISMFFWAVSAAVFAAEVPLGRLVYETAGGYGCAVCHGAAAHGAGQAGGYIRGANEAIIRKSLVEVPSMIPLQQALTDTQINQLAVYLESLAPIPLITFEFDGSEWHGTFEAISDQNSVDIVFYNNSFETTTLMLPSEHQGQELAPLASLVYRYKIEKPPIDLIWLIQQSSSWQPSSRPLSTQ